MKHQHIEVRSALPIETREDDPLAAATQAVNELRTAAEERHTAHQTEVRALNDRIAQLETRLNRPTGHTEQRNERTVEQRAFNNFLRFGNTNLTPDEVRALTVSTDAAGGYLVPDNFVAELIRNVVNFSPVRQYARVMQVAGANVRMPKRTGTMTAQWVSETGVRTTDVRFVSEDGTFHLRLTRDAARRLETDLSIGMEADGDVGALLMLEEFFSEHKNLRIINEVGHA